MNRLNLLLMRWKAGSIKDPDLSLTLKYIHSLNQDQYNESTNRQGTDPVSREDHSPDPSRPKGKRLRQGFQSGTDRSTEQDQSNL